MEKNSLKAVTVQPPAETPLLSVWAGPYGGVPAFDKYKVADFKPAIEAAMAENLNEIDAIANNTAKPTFENTMIPLEQSGATLSRIARIFELYSSSLNSDEFKPVEAEMGPKLAAHYDKITQNSKLFERIDTLFKNESKKKIVRGEKFRLIEVYHKNFVHAGAKLDAATKAKLSEVNQKLARHYAKFNQNLQGEEGELFVLIEKESELAGLPQGFREAAAEAAKAKGKSGWLVNNTRSSVDPLLMMSENRILREKVWKMFVSRGDNGDARDNNATIVEILKLRAERAKLFDLPSHAAWTLETRMAAKPENAMKLLEDLWPAATGRVRQEVADMQALVDKQKLGIKIEPWDYRFYMEKVRKDKYDLDQGEVKQYLQLDKMREAMFWVAGELFDFSFTPVTGLPVMHPDQTVYEVKSKSTGKHVGLWYFDPYARDGKNSGAWMSQYRDQSRLGGKDITTIVSNNANFVKAKPGEAVLISWDDAVTMFHEFGHALHGLSSNVTYPTLSGTAVATDYVEFPSQILEHWVPTPEVLNKFAIHYQTGKPMPKELIDKIRKASTFNQGFDTTELLSSALIDMKFHMSPPTNDPDRFERETLTALNMPKELVMRHRTPQFRHIFGSDGYSAGYYSYVWSDVLQADAFTAFTEAGGPYDKEVAKRLVKYVFSVGNTIEPAEGFRKFRGRDPKVDALKIERGFPVK
ncbi:MAG: M3 family metallopeptidase [Pyrinomonadaceae bacterium]